MKYIRVNAGGEVAEIFPYNPFEWIVNADGEPNREFLSDCRTLKNTVKVELGWIEQPDGSFSPPEQNIDIDGLRSAKKREIGDACENTIYAGIEASGKRYSLTEHDQIEILAQTAAAAGGAAFVPYHADGELCRIYTAEEFMEVSNAANFWILLNRTRCNHINAWIARAEGDELENIMYDSDLPSDLQKHMDELLAEMGFGGV